MVSYERASHSAGTLLQMQIVINNIINKICPETKRLLNMRLEG